MKSRVTHTRAYTHSHTGNKQLVQSVAARMSQYWTLRTWAPLLFPINKDTRWDRIVTWAVHGHLKHATPGVTHNTYTQPIHTQSYRTFFQCFQHTHSSLLSHTIIYYTPLVIRVKTENCKQLLCRGFYIIINHFYNARSGRRSVDSALD